MRRRVGHARKVTDRLYRAARVHSNDRTVAIVDRHVVVRHAAIVAGARNGTVTAIRVRRHAYAGCGSLTARVLTRSHLPAPRDLVTPPRMVLDTTEQLAIDSDRELQQTVRAQKGDGDPAVVLVRLLSEFDARRRRGEILALREACGR